MITEIYNLRIGTILAVLLVTVLLIMPVTGAPAVERDVTVADDKIKVTFTVDSDEPFAVGILETLPSGWSFAGEDSPVSSSEHFRADRKNGKIAFFLSDDKSVSYEVQGEGDGVTGFRTEWVDLLALSPDMDEGKERWQTLGDDEHEEDIKTGGSDTHKSPGFGTLATFAAFITAGAVLFVSGRKEA